MSETIRYIQRKEIDVDKWDACVEAAPNGLVYARSWWLDAMADNWDALVVDDYEVIMPLTWRKKWGIKYLYQPAFTQQLGIISSLGLSETLIEAFLTIAQKHFRFAEINLNFKNRAANFPAKQNFRVLLNKPYGELSGNYKSSLQKSLKRSGKQALTYNQDILIEDVIDLFVDTYQGRNLPLSTNDYQRLKAVIQIARKKEMLLVRSIFNKDQQLCTAALIPKCSKRVYFLLSVTPESQRQYMANHFLVDRLIYEFAGENVILDFEGSDLEGVAQFFENYGGSNEPYYFVRWNNLPWPISLMKR